MRQQLQLANANIKELQEKLEDSELELDREVTDEMSKEIRSLKKQLQKATKSSKDIDELKRQFSKGKDEQESELLRLHHLQSWFTINQPLLLKCINEICLIRHILS